MEATDTGADIKMTDHMDQAVKHDFPSQDS